MRNSWPPQTLQAGHSSLPQRRLESDAARRSGSTVAAGTGATPAAFYLGLCHLRGILSLPAPHDCAAGGLFFCAATKLESDAEIFAATTVAGGLFFCVGDNLCSDCQVYPMKSGIAAAMRLFPGIPCSDCQVYPIKSGIAAATRPF